MGNHHIFKFGSIIVVFFLFLGIANSPSSIAAEDKALSGESAVKKCKEAESKTEESKKFCIFALGSSADGVFPTMQLVINGDIVASWDDVRPTSGGGFNAFYVKLKKKIDPHVDRVRIALINDLDPDGTEDRNLSVDKIIVGKAAYQTEAPTTFSTGTFTQSAGCTKGYSESETLLCNGYFEYFSTQSP